MKYKLYQINLDEDTARYVFTGREEAEQFGLSFPLLVSFMSWSMKESPMSLRRKDYSRS